MIKLLYDCPEDVSHMEKTQNGVYCESCKKDVYDFRGKSPIEIKKITQEQNVSCGIFDDVGIKKDTRTIVSNIFRTAFAAVFLLGFNASTLFGQTIVHYDSTQVNTVVANTKPKIKGVVYDMDKKPIKATINYYRGSEIIKIETNERGEYEFELPIDVIGTYFYFDVQSEKMQAEFKGVDNIEGITYQFNFYMNKYKKPKKPKGNKHVRGKMMVGAYG